MVIKNMPNGACSHHLVDIRFIKIITCWVSAGLFSFLLTFIAASVFMPVRGGSAITIDASSPNTISGSSTAPVSISVDNSPLAYYISVSSAHGSSGTPVSFSYSMDGSSGSQLGNVVSDSDLVSIDTNTPFIHQLMLSTTSSSTTIKANNLTGDNTQESGGLPVPNTYIAPVSGTTTSSLNSAAPLSGNTWGFALPSNTPGIEPNNFDVDYSTATSASKFSAVPASGNEVLLTQNTGSTSNATIYYGILADRTIPAGSYSNTILYTALAEQPSEIRVIPGTIDASTSSQEITIYTSINTTSGNLGNATVQFTNSSDSTKTGSCTNPVVHTDSNNYLYITCVAPNMPSGNYDISVTLDAFDSVLTGNSIINYAGEQTLSDIATMQEMTSSICAATPIGTKANLKDTRGMGNGGSDTSSTYDVVKAADGNCWMTDNLNLYNATISAADSDFSSPSTYTIPDSITDPAEWDTNIFRTKMVEVAHGLGNRATQDQTYWGQVFYNWTVAVATEDSENVKTPPDTSICPKNWQLPVYGAWQGDEWINKSWEHLMESYNITAGDQLVANSDLGFRYYYGYWDWDNKSEYAQGSDSYFWSGHPDSMDSLDAWTMNYWGAGQYWPARVGFDPIEKGSSASIRCVAR